MRECRPDGREIPESLKQHEHWVLWAVDSQGRKRPLAPWIRGDLYPVKWGSDAPERPETDWETAWHHYRSRTGYATPSGYAAEEALPAPLLLHDPLDPPLMQVDFDDVRDPERGTISDEVAGIVEELGAFTEVSQSGEGLHCFVRAELPGGLGKFIADLDDIGEIELYDHGRAVGATWEHVPWTPTEVPEVQATVEDIIKRYETSDQRQRRVGSSSGEASPATDVSRSLSADAVSGDNDADNDRSPYFDVDVRQVADTGVFQRYRHEAPGDEWVGPHPTHGPQSSDKDECTNFGVENGGWFCFLHDCGGASLDLAAIVCPETDIRCSDSIPRSATQEKWLQDHPEDYLRTCLWLRDQGVVDDDARPPYRVLVATARHADLHMRDSDDGILGEANAEIAEAVYGELAAGDI